MEKIHRIVDLINRAQEDLLSENEQLELEQWMQKPGNRALFDHLSNEEQTARELELLSQYDANKAFRKFKGKPQITIPVFLKYASIAACFVLPLVAAVLLWMSRDVDVEQVVLSSVIENKDVLPGTKRAVLTLSDGQQVDLTQSKGQVISDGTSEIIVDSGQMVYAANESTVEVKYNSIYVPRGGEYMMCLSDGTKVYLNSDSRLTYPVVFTKNTREVTLEGEAFFEVVKKGSLPFRVKSGDMKVTVLGTKFNVKAYPEDQRMETTLVEGSVKISTDSQNIIMKPGEQVCYLPNNGQITTQLVDVSLYTCWRDGRFLFKRENLETILMALARWYDVSVSFEDIKLKDRLFTGDLKRYSSIAEHLAMLEMTTNLTFTMQGRTVIVKAKINKDND